MGNLIPGFFPPTRENWELLCVAFQTAAVVGCGLQLRTRYYPMGKTSLPSLFNIPGKIGWFTMEIPGTLALLYNIYQLVPPAPLSALPPSSSLVPALIASLPVSPQTAQRLAGFAALPRINQAMAAMFVTHYVYRAVLSPFVLNPSMAPIGVLVWLFAAMFQVANGTCIGAWIARYHQQQPGYNLSGNRSWLYDQLAAGISQSGSPANRSSLAVYGGFTIWALGLAANIYHDEILRSIRRDKKPSTDAASQDKKAPKHSSLSERKYEIPQGGLFGWILHPHYFCEWIEWLGFCILAGPACVPARVFLLNEILVMTPRALNGLRWYREKFGADKIGSRKAAFPGLL